MPRRAKDPNAILFTFRENPEKVLAKTTLANYKRHLNFLATKSKYESEQDKTKHLIQTKEDLLQYPDEVLSLIKNHLGPRLVKSATLAAVFYITGRLAEDHPYVKEFRRLYYTDSYPKPE